MINLGIIGTNWITHQFVQAALSTKKYELTAVYSRHLEKAQEFGSHYEGDIEFATDLKTFFNITHMDTIYIASPNSLHFSQAKQAILAGKNVIVEKPAFSTPKEISYMKYSSRYDQVLDGEEPNIFSTHFSGGALMDLGVYLVYAAVAWFGMPKEVHYFPRKISTGVDGLGWGILRYENFDVSIQPGKIGDSYLPSEIYFDSGTLVMNGVNAIEQAQFHDRAHKEIIGLAVTAAENPMADEAEDFANVMAHPKDPAWGLLYEEWIELARNVNQVIYDLRKNGGIKFDADNEEDF